MACIELTLLLQWRLLPFFTQTPVRDVSDAANTPEAFRVSFNATLVLAVLLKILLFKKPAEISATVRTSQGVALADIHGSVHIMGPEFEPSTSWQAHSDGRVTHLIERKGIMVTLGVCAIYIYDALP